MSRTSHKTIISTLDLSACQQALLMISNGVEIDLALKGVAGKIKKGKVEDPEQGKLPV